MSYKELVEMLEEDRSGYVEIDWATELDLANEKLEDSGYWETDIDDEQWEWDDRFDFWKFVREYYIQIEVTTNAGGTTVSDSRFFRNEKLLNDIPHIDWEEFLLPGEEMPID